MYNNIPVEHSNFKRFNSREIHDYKSNQKFLQNHPLYNDFLIDHSNDPQPFTSIDETPRDKTTAIYFDRGFLPFSAKKNKKPSPSKKMKWEEYNEILNMNDIYFSMQYGSILNYILKDDNKEFIKGCLLEEELHTNCLVCGEKIFDGMPCYKYSITDFKLLNRKLVDIDGRSESEKQKYMKTLLKIIKNDQYNDIFSISIIYCSKTCKNNDEDMRIFITQTLKNNLETLLLKGID